MKNKNWNTLIEYINKQNIGDVISRRGCREEIYAGSFQGIRREGVVRAGREVEAEWGGACRGEGVAV